MAGNLEHIRWGRMTLEPQARRPRRVPPPPPYRRDPQGHAGRLAGETQAALSAAGEERRACGLDPARLLVIRLRSVGPNQRELLKKLGVEVVSEVEDRRPLQQDLYEVTACFRDSFVKDSFMSVADRRALCITSVEELRGPGGGADPLRLAVRFADQERAKAFCRENRAGCPIPFKVQGKPRHLTHSVQHLVTIQIPDQQASDFFMAELRARNGGGPGSGRLTESQRADLFDGLEGVERPGPDERRGQRLIDDGVPDGEFYLDVDLWHPGKPALLREANEQLRALVESAGGRVTGRVTPLLQTLMIARVRGTHATLEALLAYDRVSRVDLPPKLDPVNFSIFAGEPSMAAGAAVPADGPIACLVDSGVVAGHPLLRDLVVEEQDFGSGEGTAVDQVGHGTHLAGFIVYGDVYDLLQRGGPLVPRVRLLSAKVLCRKEAGFAGESVRPGFQDEERAEGLLADAIRTFARGERKCRVFNVSIGNPAVRLGDGRQLPWALLLDELARELNVVIVVSAGNASPAVPVAASAGEMQESVRERLFTEEHALIDPASAVNALTVGGISRREIPTAADPGGRPDPVGSPKDCPSPFTRTGRLAGHGAGPCRAVKPELVGYAGNLALPPHGTWRDNDPALTEPSLHFDYNRRALSVAYGTSVAAPYVTHVCALAERELRRIYGDTPFSANLIRAAVVHSAEVSDVTRAWVRGGRKKAAGLRRELRSVGFGRPDPYQACFSDSNRAVLLADDSLPERHFHLYSFRLPSDFLDHKGQRCVRLTVAFDPPVRGTRQEYMSRAMTVQLIRGATTEQIRKAAEKMEGDAKAVKLPPRCHRLEPTLYEWSTVQSFVCLSKKREAFECPADGEEARHVWHVLVGCKPRFSTDESAGRQRYALVLSVEHSDARVDLHQALREQVRQQAQQRVRLGAQA